MLTEIVIMPDGHKNRRQTDIDTLRGKRFEQIILVEYESGWHKDSLPRFTFLLRDGDNLVFLKGQLSGREFHELSNALRQVGPPDQQILTIDR